MSTAYIRQMFRSAPTALLGRTSGSIVDDLVEAQSPEERLELKGERDGVAAAMRSRTSVPASPLRDAAIDLLAWPIATCRSFDEAEELLVSTLAWIGRMGDVKGVHAASRRHHQAELAYVAECRNAPRGTSTPAKKEIEADLDLILERNTLYIGLRGEHNLTLRIMHGAIAAFFRRGDRHHLLGMVDLEPEDGPLNVGRSA